MGADIRDRVRRFVATMPVAHRVGVVAAVAALALLAVLFIGWVTTPTYNLLYSGLDDQGLATTIDELESLGVPYRLEAGGSRVLVPREQLYRTRAALAQAGVGGRSTPPGYEILDNQGLSVSDFRQRVDYQRALEGELAKTLMAMDGVRSATVHLVVPEDRLFAEAEKPTTASVLLATTRKLSDAEVEAVTFLVASSVEGLDADRITVADATGTVLHAPGDAGGGGVMANRQLRQTREFESALAADIGALLERATGSPASVVVRATLDFDARETQTETYDRDSQVTLKEQTTGEQFTGTGALPGGTVGVDGGPLPTADGEGNYQRDEALREFGVDKVVSRSVAAPGTVERLSVAIVMDDGSVTGTDVPAAAEVETLVAAAVGLDRDRGDTVAVSAVPFPEAEDASADATAPVVDRIAEFAGIGVLLLVAGALLLMSRRRVKVTRVERSPAPAAAVIADPAPRELPDVDAAPRGDLHREVAELVQRQPEEIAALLRGWLADRRTS